MKEVFHESLRAPKRSSSGFVESVVKWGRAALAAGVVLTPGVALAQGAEEPKPAATAPASAPGDRPENREAKDFAERLIFNLIRGGTVKSRRELEDHLRKVRAYHRAMAMPKTEAEAAVKAIIAAWIEWRVQRVESYAAAGIPLEEKVLDKQLVAIELQSRQDGIGTGYGESAPLTADRRASIVARNHELLRPRKLGRFALELQEIEVDREQLVEESLAEKFDAAELASRLRNRHDKLVTLVTRVLDARKNESASCDIPLDFFVDLEEEIRLHGADFSRVLGGRADEYRAARTAAVERDQERKKSVDEVRRKKDEKSGEDKN